MIGFGWREVGRRFQLHTEGTPVLAVRRQKDKAFYRNSPVFLVNQVQLYTHTYCVMMIAVYGE